MGKGRGNNGEEGELDGEQTGEVNGEVIHPWLVMRGCQDHQTRRNLSLAPAGLAQH